MKLIDFVSAALVGKKIKVKNSYNREEWLTVESVKNDGHYVETGSSDQSNDWYPDGHYVSEFKINFTNGYSKKVDYSFEFEIEPSEEEKKFKKMREGDNPYNDRPGQPH